MRTGKKWGCGDDVSAFRIIRSFEQKRLKIHPSTNILYTTTTLYESEIVASLTCKRLMHSKTENWSITHTWTGSTTEYTTQPFTKEGGSIFYFISLPTIVSYQGLVSIKKKGNDDKEVYLVEENLNPPSSPRTYVTTRNSPLLLLSVRFKSHITILLTDWSKG